MIAPRPPTRSLTGQQVGEYLVRDLIGTGGVGEVYEGSQPVIGKRVAVKVLAAERCADLESVSRFLAEARAVNAIRHRNIVDVFSFGELPDGAPYLVMEFLEGEPFDRLIERRAPLPPVEALGYVEEVLEALSAAHAAGIVHRDIKPSNLFLVKQSRGRPYVKLLDFGAAKLGASPQGLTPTSPSSQIIGTPTYMPPEQVLGTPVGPSSDLYAVGVLLFELLTGRAVFPNVNPFESMRRHAQEPAPIPSSVVPSVPLPVDALVECLLRKDPAERPQSADAVRKWCVAIRSALESDPDPALATTLPSLPRVDVEKLEAASPTAPAPALPSLIPPDSTRPLLERAGRGQGALLAVALSALLSVGFTGLWWKRPSVEPLVVVPPPPSVTTRLHAVLPDAPPAPVEDAELASLPVPPAAPLSTRPRPAAMSRPARSPGDPLTDEGLASRKAQLEAQLRSREAEAGEPDPVVRRLLAAVDLSAAHDDGSRRVAWTRLDEIGRQLEQR